MVIRAPNFIRYSCNGFSQPVEESDFFLRLEQTISWCSEKGSTSDPKNSLRRLKPHLEWSDLCSLEHRIWSVAYYREREINDFEQNRSVEVPFSLRGGRLLVYIPDRNLHCGVEEEESLGFFDIDNIPPYDTWVHLVEGSEYPLRENDFLISWVPPFFVDLVQRTLDVHMEDCIVWLDEYKHPLVEVLREKLIP